MSNFTTRQEFFISSYTMLMDEQEKIDKFLKLLEKSGVENLISKNQITVKEEDRYQIIVIF